MKKSLDPMKKAERIGQNWKKRLQKVGKLEVSLDFFISSKGTII